MAKIVLDLHDIFMSQSIDSELNRVIENAVEKRIASVIPGRVRTAKETGVKIPGTA
jgi:hypothetical protein